MKKVAQIITLLFFFIAMSQTTIQAQVRVRDQNEPATKASNSFASHLWYGGNVGLGFSSSSFESLFQITIAPMIGYKVFEQLSVGPRVSITYINYRYKFGGNVSSANPVSFSLGLFTRYKLFRNFFAHGEYEFENTPFFSFTNNGNIEVIRQQRTNTYVGAGYNSGSAFAYEILLLYNLTLPENTVQSPFNIRFGFTYNF